MSLLFQAGIYFANSTSHHVSSKPLLLQIRGQLPWPTPTLRAIGLGPTRADRTGTAELAGRIILGYNQQVDGISVRYQQLITNTRRLWPSQLIQTVALHSSWRWAVILCSVKNSLTPCLLEIRLASSITFTSLNSCQNAMRGSRNSP